MRLVGGWKFLGHGIYESLNKTRIHVTGGVRVKGYGSGDWFHAPRHFSNEYYQCLRICGCKPKRAIMLLAELMERGEI